MCMRCAQCKNMAKELVFWGVLWGPSSRENLGSGSSIPRCALLALWASQPSIGGTFCRQQTYSLLPIKKNRQM